MFHQMTFESFDSATSSPASADGATPHDSQDGQTIASCGPARPRANHSRSQAKAKPRLTIGTCGPTCFGSSVPDGPLSSWESRLRRRLARTGSTESLLTWKASATPAGRSLSRLVPSTRPTDGIDFGSWPTPTSRDWKDGSYCPNVPVNGLLGRAVWPTPTAQEYGTNQGGSSGRTGPVRGSVSTLVRASWATPTAVDGRRGLTTRPQDTGLPLPQQLGAMLGGLLAQTEKPGALNPQFVCWLMGYATEWENCAGMVTPSSRKPQPRSSKQPCSAGAEFI